MPLMTRPGAIPAAVLGKLAQPAAPLVTPKAASKIAELSAAGDELLNAAAAEEEAQRQAAAESETSPDSPAEPEVEATPAGSSPYKTRYRGTIFDNETVRKRIEATGCGEWDESDIFQGVIRQRVAIGPSFAVTYRSIANDVWRDVERHFGTQLKETDTAMFSGDLYATYVAAVAVESIELHGSLRELPPLMTDPKTKRVDLRSIDARVDALSSLPSEFMEAVVVNREWFRERLQRRVLGGDFVGST